MLSSQEQQTEINSQTHHLNRREFLEILGVFGIKLAAEYASYKLTGIQSYVEKLFSPQAINLQFFHEYHENTQEKLQRFAQVVRETDVFITEFGPWNQENLTWFRDKEEVLEKQTPWDYIYGRGIQVYFLDPRENDPVWDAWREVEQHIYPNFNLDFDESLAETNRYLQLELVVHKVREMIWEKQLQRILREVKREQKHSGKDSLTIVVHTGAYHSHFYHKTAERYHQKQSTSIARSFSESPLIFSKRHEILRRMLFKNDSPEKHKLVEVLAESIFNSIFAVELERKFSDSPSQRVSFVRAIVESLTEDDIRSVYSLISKSLKGQKNEYSHLEKQAKEQLLQILRNRNITFL